MTQNLEIDENEFETLLGWLGDDREKAGQKYEEIRSQLIIFFSARKCLAPEDLADDTINRVTAKISGLAAVYQGDPSLYFYGVAKKVFLEYTKKPQAEQLGDSLFVEPEAENQEAHYQCLDQCLGNLAFEQRRLILSYYQHEKRTKIEARKKLQQEWQISKETLRVRAFRLREILKRCVRKCIKKKNHETF